MVGAAGNLPLCWLNLASAAAFEDGGKVGGGRGSRMGWRLDGPASRLAWARGEDLGSGC